LVGDQMPIREAHSSAASTTTLALPREIRLIDLVLFNIAATLGPQLIPASAHVGPAAIPLHIAAAALFFFPCALVVASLSKRFPGEGGFYIWTREAFGERHAFICGWCWWVSTLLFLPTLVLIAVGMAWQAANLSNERWQVAAAFGVLWAAALLNILSLRLSKWLSNIGSAMIYAGSATVFLAGLAIWITNGSATSFHFDSAMSMNRMSLWAQIAFAYTGLELGTLMGGEILNPRRTVPKAAFISAAAVALGYAAGSWSLMLVLKPEEINPISGLVQVASVAGARLGLRALGVFTTVILVIGIFGKLSTWSAGGARMPLSLSADGLFPAAFKVVHPRWKTPWVALAVQAIICSVFLLFTQSGETMRSGWQLLMDLTIEATFLPYIYIFLSAWRFGQWASGAAGLLVTLLAMGFALVPPEGTRSVLSFESKALGGSIFLVLLGLLAFRPARQKT
jgi:amino acid transporter